VSSGPAHTPEVWATGAGCRGEVRVSAEESVEIRLDRKVDRRGPRTDVCRGRILATKPLTKPLDRRLNLNLISLRQHPVARKAFKERKVARGATRT
jgi:hypothetical protein